MCAERRNDMKQLLKNAFVERVSRMKYSVAGRNVYLNDTGYADA